MNYYNENDKFAAEWLRELVKQDVIPAGDVDERDIREVRPGDVAGYTQAHFFAGIAGWSEALRLAGWPADRPVWTGSCPCQPFSQAGDRRGVEDERHLWPEFRRLIDQCRPAVVFGEQVASKDGRRWLAGVRADLEAMGHAAWAADLCAAGIGSPQIRQRLFWAGRRISNADFGVGGQGSALDGGRHPGGDAQPWAGFGRDSLPRGLSHSDGQGLEIRSIATLGSRVVRHEGPSSGPSRDRSGGLPDPHLAELQRKPSAGQQSELEQDPRHRPAHDSGLPDAQDIGRQLRPWPSDAIFAGRAPEVELEGRGEVHFGLSDADGQRLQERQERNGGTERGSGGQAPRGHDPLGSGFWGGDDVFWFEGPDSKWRRLKHGIRILAAGVQGRVGKLRGYGGSIVPQLAAVFIQEADGCLADHGLSP